MHLNLVLVHAVWLLCRASRISCVVGRLVFSGSERHVIRLCVAAIRSQRRRQRALYLRQSVGMTAVLDPTRRCNGAALLLTSLTDFANKIGDQRPPAGSVRPQADHYQTLSGFI